MMKTKKIFTAVLSILFAVCLSFAVLPFASAKADDAALPEVTMKHGASIRLSTTGTDGSDSGIKFAFSMSAEDYAALSASDVYTDVKYGVFIAAASYNVTGKEIADETHLVGDNAIYYWQVGETDGEPVYNVTPAAGMKRIICAEGDAMATETDGKAYFYGSVVNMKDENLRRDYIGVGYVKYTVNGETHYKFAAADDNVRSVETVARVAYTADPELRDKLVSLYLNKVARDCVVTTAPVAVADLVENGEAQALVTAGEADAYSEMRYSLDNETFSTEIPTAETAGEYTVWYKAVARMPFDHDSEVKSVVVTIAEIPDGVITLKPAKITDTKKDGKWTFGGTYDYKGLGEYKVGDVLTFRFKGKNIPNVGLFVDKNGVNAIGGGTENTGLFVQTSGHISAAYNKRLIIVGPYLADAGGPEYYPGVGAAGYVAYREWVGANYEMGADLSYEVGGRFSLFGIDFLDDNTDYVYRISSAKTASAATVTLNFTLNSVSGGTETQVTAYSKTVTHLLPSLENRFAVAYGTGDIENGRTITFEATIETPPESNEITLQPAAITETRKDGKWAFGGTYDYKGLGEYKVGDALEFTFKGRNIPNVGLFVNKNGVNPIGGGTENTGLFVQTSGHGSVAYNKRLIIAGPYLVDAGGPEYYPGEAGYPAYREWVSANYEMGVDVSYEVDGGRFSRFGIEMLDENTNYVYRIESSDGTDKQVTLKFILYTVNENGERTEYANFVRTVTHLLPSLENRYAVVYGAGDYYSTNSNQYTGKPITFSYEVKKAA